MIVANMGTIYYFSMLFACTFTLGSCFEAHSELLYRIDLGVIQRCESKVPDIKEIIAGYWSDCLFSNHLSAVAYLLYPNLLSDEVCRDNKFMKCMESYHKKFEMCMPPEVLVDINDMLVSNKAGFDFLCNNDAHVLKELRQPEAQKCFHYSLSQIDSCEQSTVGTKMPDYWLDNNFNSETSCTKRAQWSTCVAKAFDACQNPNVKNNIKGFLSTQLNSTPCKKIVIEKFPELMPSEKLQVKTTPKPVTTNKATETASTIKATDTTPKPPPATPGGSEKLSFSPLFFLFCIYLARNV